MVETLVDIVFCSKQIMVIEQKRGVKDSIERHKKASKCQEYRGKKKFTSPSTGFSGFTIFGVPGKEIECK
jgi:hypothetical protein